MNDRSVWVSEYVSVQEKEVMGKGEDVSACEEC